MPTRIVLLDTGPLGMVTHPRKHRETKDWLERLLKGGARVVIPEIADYELRRSLLRIGAIKSVGRLDALESALDYLPISTAVMRRAAQLWADARRTGHPTAPDPALDGDVILAAQVTTSFAPADDAVVATDNVGDLSRFVTARRWVDIS